MYEGFNILAFLIGFPLPLLIMATVFYFTRKSGKKNFMFDERYKRIHDQGKAIAWGVTSVAMYIAWMIVMIVEGPRLAFFILTGLWVTHFMSYLIGTLIANNKN